MFSAVEFIMCTTSLVVAALAYCTYWLVKLVGDLTSRLKDFEKLVPKLNSKQTYRGTMPQDEKCVSDQRKGFPPAHNSVSSFFDDIEKLLQAVSKTLEDGKSNKEKTAFKGTQGEYDQKDVVDDT